MTFVYFKNIARQQATHEGPGESEGAAETRSDTHDTLGWGKNGTLHLPLEAARTQTQLQQDREIISFKEGFLTVDLVELVRSLKASETR